MSIIKPCERTKVLAAKALEIQDACNITAVAGFLQTTCVELSRIGNDSQGVAKHPSSLTFGPVAFADEKVKKAP